MNSDELRELLSSSGNLSGLEQEGVVSAFEALNSLEVELGSWESVADSLMLDLPQLHKIRRLLTNKVNALQPMNDGPCHVKAAGLEKQGAPHQLNTSNL